MKTIAISGISGFVGSNLKRFFKKRGYEVTPIKRDDLKDEEKLISIVENSHIIINLSGANIIARWSEKYKKILRQSRIDTTNALVYAINKAKKQPKLFISTSAVGIYKTKKCYDEENCEFADDFLATLCKEWEESAQKALHVRVCIFRFGIVLGDGGALKKMLPPFRFGLGGNIGSGKQYVSFIHIEDLLRAYEFVIENEDLKGAFNLTSPHPTTNEEFTKSLGEVLRKPTIFPIPEFVLKLIFGEGAKVLTSGQCLFPKRLIDSGFSFEFGHILDVLKDLTQNMK